MEFLKTILTVACVSMHIGILGCADRFDPVISKPSPINPVEKLDQNFLSGQFSLESGQIQNLQDLSDKPLLIYFVGEFCGSCRMEAAHLKQLIAQKGLPTKIHLVSVMIDVTPGVATEWFESIEPQTSSWILGSDLNLALYYQYFQQLVTPSLIYFDPQTQILKRWQTVISIPQLEQEIGSWY